jgi:hypothetical protein
LAALGERLTTADVDRQILRAAADADVPFHRLHDRKAMSNSRIKRIESVLDRLDLVEILGRKEAGQMLWMHYWGIYAYLLLTCFDLLGQERGWLEPAAWLRANDERVAFERAEALAQGLPGVDHVAAAATLLDAHSKIYGVRHAFRRFVVDVLPIEARRSLLSCIAIEQGPTPPAKGDFVELGDEKKIDWLMKVRNGYTHSALYAPGLHLESTPADYRDEEAWWVMSQTTTSALTTIYSVKRWPLILAESVRAGLAEYVRRLKR